MDEENKIIPVEGIHFNPLSSKPAITSESLEEVEPFDYNTPDQETIYPVGDIDTSAPPLQPTEGEGQASDLISQIQGLGEQTLGESAFRAEQEATEGLPELQATQTDLTAQLKAIQNEAKAIPLQMQQEATGRGITVGGLAPLQTARLRTNAIQALGVNSLLEASRGNIATAQTMADRAVAQKFDPIREQIRVATANLELIINDPKYTLEQQNRAQAQLDIQNKKIEDADAQEAEAKAISSIAIQAAQSGVNASTLNQIQNATTELEATQIAQQAGVFTTTAELDTQIVETDGRKMLVNMQTGERIDLGSAGASEQSLVESMIKKYGDAGILQTDTLQEASAKLKNSRIYQKATKVTSGTNYSKLLSIDDAQKLGVPYGTTVGQAVNMGLTPEDDASSDIQKFELKAVQFGYDIESDDKSWEEAFNLLKAEFPQASDETINAKLGGGIPYNQETGEFDTSGAWGRAKD